MKLLTVFAGLIGAAIALRLELYAQPDFLVPIDVITEEPVGSKWFYREVPRSARSYKFDDEGKHLRLTGFNNQTPWYGTQQCGSGESSNIKPSDAFDVVRIEAGNKLNGC